MIFRYLALLAIAAPATAEPAMWVVRDADTEIILFGSLHELPPGIDWLTQRVAARVDGADTLVVEAIIPDDREAMVGLVNAVGYSPKLPPLSARVAPRLQGGLSDAVRKTGLFIAALDRMETWLAAISIGDAVLATLGLDAANGVEVALTARVKARGVPVIGLETAAQQLGFFDTLSETDQRAMLDSTVVDTATAAADTKRLTDAWMAGDSDAIARDFSDSLRATPRLAQVLLTERNARWADWIAARLAQPGKVFMAVGAAHLAGGDSVQAKLAAKGLKAERLP